jgi:hypothetical protein
VTTFDHSNPCILCPRARGNKCYRGVARELGAKGKQPVWWLIQVKLFDLLFPIIQRSLAYRKEDSQFVFPVLMELLRKFSPPASIFFANFHFSLLALEDFDTLYRNESFIPDFAATSLLAVILNLMKKYAELEAEFDDRAAQWEVCRRIRRI